MHWKTSNATFGFKMDLQFGFPVPKNIYAWEIRPLNCILRTFFSVLRDFITAHAQKHFNSASGFKTDLRFGLLVPKNVYMREIRR